MITLSIMIVGVVIAMLIGVPLGIWSARPDRAERVLRGFLDTAQVMPAFVYLGPLVLALGIAVPAGGRRHRDLRRAAGGSAHQPWPAQVPVVSNEVGHSFGSTRGSSSCKVQLPLAKNTILLGLNQVIMMAFGIVVIGVAARHRRHRWPRCCADCRRATSAWRSPPASASCSRQSPSTASARANGRGRAGVRTSGSPNRRTAARVMAWRWSSSPPSIAKVLGGQDFPHRWRVDIAGSVDDAVDWIQREPAQGRSGDRRHAVASATSSCTTSSNRCASSCVWLPWLVVVVGLAAVGVGQQGLAAGGRSRSASCHRVDGHGSRRHRRRTQIWDLAMDTLSQVLVALLVSVLPRRAARRAGRPVAVVVHRCCARSSTPRRCCRSSSTWFRSLFLFNVGRTPGVIASVIYAVPPCIRLTASACRRFPSRHARRRSRSAPRRDRSCSRCNCRSRSSR